MEETFDLQLTGERTLPGIPIEKYWFARHLAAYEFAATLSSGKRVIDIGCGEGYGPSLLSRTAAEVLGIDIAPEVIEHARKTYRQPNLSFEVMNVNRLEVPVGSFDVAISFQVVEHLVDEGGYFSEIARVLAPDGLALITTPNRLTISPGSRKPINPFHLREYTPDELGELLADYFESVEISGLFHARMLALNDRIKLVDFIKVYEMSRANPRYWAHRVFTPMVSTRDFRLDGSNMERCLDIVAACRHSRGGQA
jgi:SAM-dependent methyltransferase